MTIKTVSGCPGGYPAGREDSVLLVVDIQEKLAAAMSEGERSRVCVNTNRLLEGCAVYSVPAVVTEQYPEGLGPTVKDLSRVGVLHVFEKITFDALAEKTVESYLSELGRKTVIIAGMEAHICVFFTAMHLLSEGFRVIVAADAVCSRNEINRDMALLQLRKSDAFVLPTETILFSLAERGGSDQFRKISSLVK